MGGNLREVGRNERRRIMRNRGNEGEVEKVRRNGGGGGLWKIREGEERESRGNGERRRSESEG